MYVHFKKGSTMEQRSDGLKSGLLKHGQQSLLREKVKHLQYFMKIFEIGTVLYVAADLFSIKFLLTSSMRLSPIPPLPPPPHCAIQVQSPTPPLCSIHVQSFYSPMAQYKFNPSTPPSVQSKSNPSTLRIAQSMSNHPSPQRTIWITSRLPGPPSCNLDAVFIQRAIGIPPPPLTPRRNSQISHPRVVRNECLSSNTCTKNILSKDDQTFSH